MNGHQTPSEVSAAQAKAHLLEYLRRAQRGQATIISKRGARVAALVPIEQFVRTQESTEFFVQSLEAMLVRARRGARARKRRA